MLVRLTIPTETTSVSEYPSILDQWRPSGLVDHFLDEIPEHATDVRFSAFPGFLQGGAHIQVRMSLSQAEVSVIAARMNQAAKQEFRSGSIYEHSNEDPESYVPTPVYYTCENPDRFEFPDHFTIYVLDAVNMGAWNHGKTCGAAVSIEAGEVIYWAEDW